MTDIITNSQEDSNTNQNISNNSVDKPTEIKTTPSLEDATKELLSLHGKFKTLSKEEISTYFNKEEISSPIFKNIIPMGRDKTPAVGGASTTACKLTQKGFENLIDTYGTLQRIEGINDDEDVTKPIKAYGFAIQCRYDFINIDLDASVFAVENVDGRNKLVTKLPEKLIIWVATHHPYALKSRGNRARLTLYFRTSFELKDYLKNKGNKFNYSLTTGVGEKVEINFGNVNNTPSGQHSNGKQYQQILPDSEINNGLMGELSLEDFVELEKILTEESYEKSSYTGKASQGRVLLEDAFEIWSGALDDMDTYRNLSTNFAEENKPVFKISFRDLLNPEVKECLEGLKYFNGSTYKEADGDEVYSVSAGNRFWTWFNAGSDVNSLVWLFDRLDIDYDQDEIDSIIDELWEHTDTASDKPGGDEYTTDNALANFNATSMAPTVKIEYLRNALLPRLRLIISNIWETSKQAEIALRQEKRKKLLEEKRTETKTQDSNSDPISDQGQEKEMNQDIEINDQEKKIYSQEDFESDFMEDVEVEPISQEGRNRLLFGSDYVDADRKEDERKGHQEKVDKLDGKLPSIDVGELVGNINEKTEATRNAYLDAKSDDWSLLPEPIREVLEPSADTECDGLSFAYTTQTLALLAGVSGYVTTKNKEVNKHKEYEQLGEYHTRFIPFTAVIGDSGNGKSEIRKQFHEATLIHLSNVDKLSIHEQQRFEYEFCEKNKDKFKPIVYKEGVNPPEPEDKRLRDVASIVTYGARVSPRDFLSFSNKNRLGDLTDAGYRDALVAQTEQTNVRRATNGEFYGDAYKHPVCLYGDELNNIFVRLFDSSMSFGGNSSFFMERKEGGMLEVARGSGKFSFTNAGMSMAGCLVTSKIKEYIERELRDGTDGVTPRFHFDFIEKKDENRDRSLEKYHKNRSIEAQVEIFGTLMMARQASINAEQLPDCPFFNDVDNYMSYSMDAHNEQVKFIEAAITRRDNLIAKFPEATGYIRSLFGKANAELSVYATGINLLRQCNALWQLAKTEMPDFNEIYKVSRSDDNFKHRHLNDQLFMAFSKATATTKTNKFEFSLDITGEDVRKSSRIMMHHYAFIEMIIESIALERERNMSTRTKEATQEKVIESVKGDSFVFEKQTQKVIKGICNTVINATPAINFTVSELSRRCNIVRTLIKDENIRRAEQILDMLCGLDVLERTHISSTGTQKYHLKISVIELNKRTPSILAAIAESF